MEECSCGFTPKGADAYLLHYRIHRNDINFEFSCPNNNCGQSFTKFAAIKSHYYRDHKDGGIKNLVQRKSLIQTNIYCNVPFCHKKLDSLFAAKKHLVEHIESNIEVYCPVRECQSKFSSKNSLRCHFSRYHQHFEYVEPDQDETEVDILSELHVEENTETHRSTELQEDPSEKLAHNTGTHSSTDDPEGDGRSFTKHLFYRNMALFFLNLKAKYLLPSSTVQYIFENYGDLYNLSLETQAVRLKELLSFQGLSQETVNNVILELQCNDQFAAASDQTNGPFRSAYARMQFFKEKFDYVVPEEMYLGKDSSNQNCYYHYIPIITSLQNMFADELVREQYFEPMHTHHSFYSDFTDGLICLKSDFFSKEGTIKLLLFQDAFEIVNPLGSGKKKHSLLAVYFTLGNLHPYNRSKIDQIQLILLCKEVHFKYFGLNKVFSRLMEDLTCLEMTGIDINAGSLVKGGVVMISGDNLGSHTLGGFIESFSGHYFCRFCLITRDQFLINPTATGVTRTKENYDECIDTISEDNNLVNFQGVKRNSPFNSLNHFHVCNPGLPPCLGHDLFEGVVTYDLHLLLMELMKTKDWFSLAILNHRINNFRYQGNDADDKPAKVSDTIKHLSGHAIQNWVLLRMLPILIFDKIQDPEDKVWLTILKLRELVELVCCPNISCDQVTYMHEVIQNFLCWRRSLFPDVRLRPKHHFLMHYADLTIQFGPLCRVWTMRYESKHTYFKQAASSAGNFKNITKNLTAKHQLLQASLSAGNMFVPETIAENAVEFHMEHFNDKIMNCVKACNDLQQGHNLMSHALTWRGTSYKKDKMIVICCNGKSLTVGKILTMLINKVQNNNKCKTTVYFIAEIYEANYDASTGCFIVSEISSNKVKLIRADNLADFYPLDEHRKWGSTFLVLHHAIGDIFD